MPRVLYEWTQMSKSDVHHISPHLALSRLPENIRAREIKQSVKSCLTSGLAHSTSGLGTAILLPLHFSSLLFGVLYGAFLKWLL